MRALNCSCDRPRGRWRGLFCGVCGESEGPESIVVGAFWVVEEDLPQLDQYNTVCDEGGPNIFHLFIVELRAGEEVSALLTCLQDF